MTVMDATRVSHQSPDTDVSNEDAEIFEVRLNSAKLLSAGRTCVGVCMHVHVYLCDTLYTQKQQEVFVCQAPPVNLHFHTLTYFTLKIHASAKKRILILCLLHLNLRNTTHLQLIFQEKKKTSV